MSGQSGRGESRKSCFLDISREEIVEVIKKHNHRLNLGVSSV